MTSCTFKSAVYMELNKKNYYMYLLNKFFSKKLQYFFNVTKMTKTIKRVHVQVYTKPTSLKLKETFTY